MIKVTIWNEFIHEKTKPLPARHYPNGIHNAIKEFLDADGRFEVKTAALEGENCGITKELLDNTDVLLWWGHVAHEQGVRRSGRACAQCRAFRHGVYRSSFGASFKAVSQTDGNHMQSKLA